KTVISAKDIEDLIRTGGDPKSLDGDAIFTPSARELLRDLENRRDGAPSSPVQVQPNNAAPASLNSKSPKAELEAAFKSPAWHDLKLQICEVGRRLWQRAYVDGNGGNIAVRVGEDIALCTPTLVSKGFMKPEEMCLVDLEGNQLCSGNGKKRTSEILMHLQIMKRQPRAVATVHCHPPYSPGFAAA